MLARLSSATVIGIEARPVVVEVTTRNSGQPMTLIVGLPDAAVRESRERVYSALRQARFVFPPRTLVINLAPADLKKEGASFDLPIALAILAAEGVIPTDDLCKTVILGELALDGTVRKVHGVLPIAVDLKEAGFTRFLVPLENALEAAVVPGILVYGVRHLLDAVYHIRGDHPIDPTTWQPSPDVDQDGGVDMRDVRGQWTAKRALEVAAAGGHNLLMIGPPGAGKTMLARRLPTILPPLERREAIETSRIHSVAGLMHQGGLMVDRPFRAPHHTISYAGLVGGGAQPRPGEITLAHHGVLFLDELPEFHRSVLEVLRQPLESGWITVARATMTLTFPARFMLVAAMNPCPCGFYGSDLQDCRCTPGLVHRYRRKISGPLLDRIDLHIVLPGLQPGEIGGISQEETSAKIRSRVVAARRLQWDRYKGTGLTCNAGLTVSAMEQFCPLDRDARSMLLSVLRQYRWSARGYHRVIKLARTLADLDCSETIRGCHVAEAVQYRIGEPDVEGVIA